MCLVFLKTPTWPRGWTDSVQCILTSGQLQSGGTERMEEIFTKRLPALVGFLQLQVLILDSVSP